TVSTKANSRRSTRQLLQSTTAIAVRPAHTSNTRSIVPSCLWPAREPDILPRRYRKRLIMLIVVSPAKTLDYQSDIPRLRTTRPRLLEQSSELVARLRHLGPQ